MIRTMIGGTLLVVIETGNLDRLRVGQPMIIEPVTADPIRKILVVHCPDLERMRKEIVTHPHCDMHWLAQLLDDARSWPEVRR